MTVKKTIELIEQNSRHHLEDIKLYNEILKKYEESGKTGLQPSELTKNMSEIFLGVVTMNKKQRMSRYSSTVTWSSCLQRKRNW
ncbi:MAG: hypothetical protein ACYDAJ_08085 [Nitrosotalea sp.]